MFIHEAHSLIPYGQDQLFDLAADVERYPDFVPWWVAARVRKRVENVYYTDQIIGFAMVRRRFGSKTVLQRPGRIDVTSSDGVVRSLHLTWLFEPRPHNRCHVSLVVELELLPQLVEDLFARAMTHAVDPIMSAFEARAHRVYGPKVHAHLDSGDATPPETTG